MEPRDRAAQTLSGGGSPSAQGRTRLRLAAASLLLVGLALVQDPGFLVPDTKFDLVAAPGEFLTRALHLWDAEGAFGQVQNQAYGYLWPMGPFFWVGDLLDLQGWLVQRLWLALVLVIAFLGAAKVARALGVRSDLACVVGGFAFALSPRMLTTLGPISIEAWPSALAPWVLLALVRGSERGSPRRWAALAGFAVAMVGGVNAAATFAVVPLGVVWLLTRTPGPRRRSLMLWWPLFTVVGTLWWLVPLFVLGAYSPPFLDYIETSSVTTLPTTVWDILRGTSNWVPYVDSGSRAGNDLITTSYLALNSALVLLVGTIGLLDRRTPHRSFLGLALLVGTVMVGLGHQGATAGWFAGDLAGLLDGALSPLRNVHKYDPIVRLPLVLGLAFFLDRALPPRADASGDTTEQVARPPAERANTAVLVAMVLLGVVGASLPALQGRITPAGGFLAVPGYWQDTADWLAEDSSGGTALLVPGATFGNYLWGSPRDEPLQHLAASRWAVRNVIPLAPPGGIRMLDSFEDRLAQGHGSAGLAAALARAGVEHVVVRNDLVRSSDVPDPVLVHQAVADSGLERVAQFGPTVGGGALLDFRSDQRVLANDGWQSTYPAVEVYAVPGGAGAAVTAEGVSVVAGGPEDLVDLDDLGVLGDAPAVLATDLAGEPGEPARRVLDVGSSQVVLTDGLRAREQFFARIHDGASAAITPGDVRQTGNPTRDYLPTGADRWSTRVELSGAESISANDSLASATAVNGSVRGDLPYAALDGDPASQWVSGSGRADRAYWRVDLEARRELTSVVLTGGADASDNQQVVAVTEAGTSDPVELGPGETRQVALPAGDTGWLEVRDDSPTGGRALAVAEVGVDGLDVRRALQLPALPEEWGNPRAVVLRADLDARRGCVVVEADVRCASGRDRAGEEQAGFARVVPLGAAGTWTTQVGVRPRAGAALDESILDGQPVRIQTSSYAVPDPRGGAVAAIDGDRHTTWMAEPEDIQPTIDLEWLGRKRITGIKFGLDREVSARRPLRVRIEGATETREVDLDERGRAEFPAFNTDSLRISVVRADDTQSLDFAAQPRPIGIGVTTLRLRGLDYLPLELPGAPRALACGSGPDLVVDGTSSLTAVSGSPAELSAGVTVPALVCPPGAAPGDPAPAISAPLDLPAGEVRIAAAAGEAFEIASVVLTDPGAEPAFGAATAAPVRSTPAGRVVEPDDDSHVLALRQNVNPGWTAEQDGAALVPVTVDGWQQGWLVNGSAAPVRAEFAPDRAYRLGLLAGGLALLALAVTVGLGVVRRSRPPGQPPPALTTRALPAPLAWAAALVAGGLVAGFGGLGVAALTVAAVGVLRRFPDAVPWACALPCLVAGAAFAVRPWGGSDGWAGAWAWPSYLMVVPLVSVVALAGWEALGRRAPQASAGRSTAR